MAYLGRKGASAALTTADIPDSSITTAKLVDSSVNSAKIGVDVIVAEDIANNAVTVAELADNAVTQAKLADDAVGTAELANNVVINTSGAITTTGAFTSVGIDDNASGATAITIDSDEDVTLTSDLKLSQAGGILYLGRASDAAQIHRIYSDSGNNLKIASDLSSGGSISFVPSSTSGTAIALDSDGNVGIGQTTPASDNSTPTFLHIGNSSSAQAGLVLEDNQNKWEIISDETFHIKDRTTERIKIYSGGEIRLTNPAGGTTLDFWTGNRFGPTADRGLDLGNSTYKWSELHVQTVNEYSDRQGKNTITDCELGENFLNQLQARKFKFNDGGTDHHAGVRLHYGLIAQEVEDILESNNIELDDFAPVCKERIVDENGVEPDEDDYIETLSYSLRYSQFIAPLIKSIQELSAKVTALENA